MSLIELESIEEALRRDEITNDEAGEIIFNKAKKPWHTESWKDKRKELIKETCEQCGSKKSPMVLQHTWHPSSYSDKMKANYKLFYEKEKLDKTVPEVENEEVHRYLARFTETAEVCPSCEAKSGITKRKTKMPIYRCRRCCHEYDDPKLVPYHPEIGVSPTFNQVKERKMEKKIQDYIWETFGVEIKKRAILKSIEEHKRYMTLEDTKTFCKRCAFLWDMKRKKVCDVCKDTLIPIQMHACYKCQEDGHPGVL